MKIKSSQKLTKLKWLNMFEVAYIDNSGHKRYWQIASRAKDPKCITKKFTLPDAVVIVPFHTAENKIVVTKEYRIPLADFEYGFPAGLIDEGETIEQASRRELKEETGLDISLRSIINVVSNMLSPTLHTLAIVLLAGVKSGELCACDDLEVLEWFPISGAMPELAFEADEFIIRRVQHTKFEEGLPVDPKSGKMLYLSG